MVEKEPLGKIWSKLGLWLAIVKISWVKFCPDKGFLSAIYCVVIKYLSCSSAGVYSQVRRTFLEQKLHERSFYTKRNGRPDGKHSDLVPDRWPSNLNQLQHCPDVQATRLTLLYSQMRRHLCETRCTVFICGFSWYAPLLTVLWRMPLRGQTVNHNLKWNQYLP